MEIWNLITTAFWFCVLSLVVYCLVKAYLNNKRLKALQRAHMKRSEEMVKVTHKGVEMPIRTIELLRFNSMNREQKNDMVADYLRHMKKGKIVDVGGGIVFKKDLIKKTA